MIKKGTSLPTLDSYVTERPTAMLIFHNGTSDFAQGARQAAVESVFTGSAEQLQHNFHKCMQFNAPLLGYWNQSDIPAQELRHGAIQLKRRNAAVANPESQIYTSLRAKDMVEDILKL